MLLIVPVDKISPAFDDVATLVLNAPVVDFGDAQAVVTGHGDDFLQGAAIVAAGIGQDVAGVFVAEDRAAVVVAVGQLLDQYDPPIVVAGHQVEPVLRREPVVDRLHVGAGESVQSWYLPTVIADYDRPAKLGENRFGLVADDILQVFGLDLLGTGGLLNKFDAVRPAGGLGYRKLLIITGGKYQGRHIATIMT